MSRQDLDEMARRRCLVVLSLLSGETTLAEAAESAECSPITVQKYETRALEAMLGALSPDASPDGTTTSSTQRIADLEKRLSQLEREKRRAERLLMLTRQMIRSGPITTGVGRRPGSRSRRKSENAGAPPSQASTTTSRPRAPPPKTRATPSTSSFTTTSSSPAPPPPTPASTPTPAGEGVQ
jgi:hypothetical protein